MRRNKETEVIMDNHNMLCAGVVMNHKTPKRIF